MTQEVVGAPPPSRPVPPVPPPAHSSRAAALAANPCFPIGHPNSLHGQCTRCGHRAVLHSARRACVGCEMLVIGPIR